jgi:hypothetical protein
MKFWGRLPLSSRPPGLAVIRRRRQRLVGVDEIGEAADVAVRDETVGRRGSARACAAVNPPTPTVPTVPPKFTPLKICSINGTLSCPARTALKAARNSVLLNVQSLIWWLP